MRQRAGERASRAPAALLALALVAATFAVYHPVASYPFVAYDDGVRLLENPAIRGGLSVDAVALAFTSVWDANWSPLTWLSHMADFSLWGDDAGGHHLTALALHVLNVLLLFGALREATGATWRPAIVAGLLALHPLHVESVAWISERKGLLSSSFGLLSLWGYVRFCRTGRRGARAASLAFLALGLLCKSMLVTLPVLLLLLDDWPLARLRSGPAALRERFWKRVWERVWERVREKWPFFAVAGLTALATVVAQSLGGAVRPFDALPLGPRLANAVVSTVAYLGKLAWPADLAAFYPHRSLPGGPGHSPAQVTASAGVLLAVTVAALRLAPPPVRTGWLWFLVALLPVSGVVQVGSQAMADRYAYLPAIGIYLAVTWGVATPLARAGPAARVVAASIALALLLAAGIAASHQVASWRSSEALFRHALAHTNANYSMHYNLANVLKRRGRTEEAIAEYRRAIAIFPHMGRAHYNLANTLLDAGRTEEAIRHYRAAVEAMPGAPGPWHTLGRALLHQGDLSAALSHYRGGVERWPEAPESHGLLGHALRLAGRYDEALRAYETAARLSPEGGDAWQRNADEVRARLAEGPGGRAEEAPSPQAPSS